MKFTLLVVGKTSTNYISQGIGEYAKRIAHYAAFDVQYMGYIKNTKSLTEEQQKQTEGRAILATLERADDVILLDERGSDFTSVKFAEFVQKKMSSGVKRAVFVIGGPYGFSKEVYDRANGKISLSRMTFPHDLVRLIFVEQLYRAFTILNHEPYHHE
ncbi:MAG: 23S rRNA (pseudouridine(1915)-N(3))-methyltransferase RlmH [Muribaculaceae bacterium]|nr:23S rRNA (pseudouridine(1915)-N(3))-methyltransferase RlmH [Muribaculaceae bacterium]